MIALSPFTVASAGLPETSFKYSASWIFSYTKPAVYQVSTEFLVLSSCNAAAIASFAPSKSGDSTFKALFLAFDTFDF